MIIYIHCTVQYNTCFLLMLIHHLLLACQATDASHWIQSEGGCDELLDVFWLIFSGMKR